MNIFYNEKDIEVGIDEVGRGCLSGPVYAGAVIMPKKFNKDDELYKEIKDSKKLSHKKRVKLAEYIKKVAISWSVGIVYSDEIDKINILQASFKAMHKAIDNLKIIPEQILVDGTFFKPYINKKGDFTSHKCIPGGDNKYLSIAAASIIAKVERDNYITDLCDEYPYLKEYGWDKNKGYGTKQHREAIVRLGLTKYHRRTFGICKKYAIN